jgi:cytochrome c553
MRREPTEHRGMRDVALRNLGRAAFILALCAIAPSTSGRADDLARQGLQAKLDYCTTCHGPSGQGYRGYFAIPRLAGQQEQYIANQLRAFIERRRLNPIMSNVAHALDPAMIAGLAAHFHQMNPPPYGGAPRGSVALGKKIFEEGLPESNVPACFACHGVEAKGHGEIPRLAGQLYWYIIKVLSNWSKERGQGSAKDISAIMVPTTHNLNQREVAAIAAYLSTLK